MTQLDSLDDTTFQHINENGTTIQCLDRELSLLEHRISCMYFVFKIFVNIN